MNFFFDRCMSFRLAQMLHILEHGQHIVRHHDDDPRFHQQTIDTEWIETLASDEDEWSVFSRDDAMLKNKVERRAIEESGLTFVFFSGQWRSMPIREKVSKFFQVWPRLLDDLSKLRRPEILIVRTGKSLKIEQL